MTSCLNINKNRVPKYVTRTCANVRELCASGDLESGRYYRSRRILIYFSLICRNLTAILLEKVWNGLVLPFSAVIGCAEPALSILVWSGLEHLLLPGLPTLALPGPNSTTVRGPGKTACMQNRVSVTVTWIRLSQ